MKENADFKPAVLCLRMTLGHILLVTEGLSKYLWATSHFQTAQQSSKWKGVQPAHLCEYDECQLQCIGNDMGYIGISQKLRQVSITQEQKGHDEDWVGSFPSRIITADKT